MSPLGNLLLAVLGLPVVIGVVAGVARHLVYRHADQHGGVIRAAGRDLPTRAEAAQAAGREDNLAAATHRALAARGPAR